MFDFVIDVVDYFNFLFWCGGVEICCQDESGMEVCIDINFKGIKQYFVMCNMQQCLIWIDMEFVDGLFKKFMGLWCFILLCVDVCKIEFVLYYEFLSILFEKIIGLVFSYIVNMFVDLFVKCVD